MGLCDGLKSDDIIAVQKCSQPNNGMKQEQVKSKNYDEKKMWLD